ncbi:MAG: amino acid adenylation domain-containing protein [Acidobacteria bacterium]|nr:amino acid adenylation domain-containing protein [Acidobacteriota bacterium]
MNFENKCNVFSLTHPQKRIFLQTMQVPDSSWPVDLYLVKYREPVVFELLSRALNIYVKESDGLRVKLIPDSTGRIVNQYFPPHVDRQWEILDFSGPDEMKFSQWKNCEKNRRFNIFEDILYDFCLVTFPDGKQGFSMLMHHLCSDGFTRISAVSRVTELYQDMVCDRPLSESTSTSYREFIAYEQAYLKSVEFVRDREFWMSENLQELNEYRIVPMKVRDNPNRYGSVRYEIPEDLYQSMTQLHQSSGLSLFTQFFTVLAVIVHRITSLDSFAISFFGHNRTREDMKATTGMFTGTYPLRIDIEGNLSFLDLAKYMSTKIKKIVKVHGMFPFDELVKLIREKEHTDINHVIDLSIIDLCYPNVPHCELSHVEGMESQNQLSISIERYDNPELQSTILFLFDSRIYLESDIRNLFSSICSMLHGVFLEPSAKISKLPLISPEQYQKLVHEFNQTSKPFPKDKCAHHLFEEAALKDPSNTAIECGGRSITYGKLNQQSDLLAEKLRYAGIGPEKLVAIYMDKSIETVIAFLAVLKAGGAYVPIDPALPVERIQFILKDTDSACLVVHQRFADPVRKVYQGKCVVCVDDRFIIGDWEERKPHSTGEAQPHNLMYVIYTSGSTGKPKGVMVEHHGFVNMVSDQVQRYQLTEKDRFLHFISFSFDASQEHLFRVLCSGAVLCLTDVQKNLNEVDIRSLLKAQNITCCAFPASLLETLDEKEFPAMKVLSSGADKCSLALVRKWGEGRRFFNSYGPTEATVLSTISQLDVGETEPHIGKPIANVQAYVLDKYGMPLPAGVAGELYIGGEGVARGYLNQPELTESCFVPNPFDLSGESRLYRTGDIVYFRDDGNLVFVGRRDKQCKIRGFRIEPDEIKETMLQHPGVKEAAVLVHKSRGRQQLTAFFVFGGETPPDVDFLKTYLSEKLPFYMVPEILVAVDSIPLTTHGKIDEKGLFQHLSNRPDVREMEHAQSETERTLKRLWCEVLNVKDISITENFFYSGGDSLMALEMCVVIEKHFSVNISIQQFMQSPTIKSIGAMLDRKKQERKTTVRVKTSGSGAGSLVVLHGFNGECNYGHIFGRELDDSLEIYALSVDEVTLRNLKIESLQDLAAFHIEQLLKQNPAFPLLLCGFSWSGALAYEMAVALEKRKIPVELLLIDTKYPGISNCDIGERLRYCIFHSLRAIFYLFKPVALVLGSITRVGRDRLQFLMDETLLELQLYFRNIKYLVWKGSPISPMGKQSVRKSLRLIPINPSPCPPSLRVHYIMTYPDSFLKKILLTDQSARWGKQLAVPLDIHELDGKHKDLITKNLSATTNCIQDIINSMTDSEKP